VNPAAVLGPGEDRALSAAYRHLRIAIGLLALSLPFAVVIGKGLLNHSWVLQGSISAYYYTHSRNYSSVLSARSRCSSCRMSTGT
jgi:hypothetical protein